MLKLDWPEDGGTGRGPGKLRVEGSPAGRGLDRSLNGWHQWCAAVPPAKKGPAMSEEYSIPPELSVTVTRTASYEKKTREALWENKIIFGSYMALARPWQLLLDKTSMLSPRMAPPPIF